MLSASKTCTVSCVNNMPVTLKRSDESLKKSLDRRKTYPTQTQPHTGFSGPGRRIDETEPIAAGDILTRQPSFIHKNLKYVSTVDKPNPNRCDTIVEKPATVKSLYFKRTSGIRQSWNNLWRINNKSKVKSEKIVSTVTPIMSVKNAVTELSEPNKRLSDDRTNADRNNNRSNRDGLALDCGDGLKDKCQLARHHRRVQSFTTYDYWIKRGSASCVNTNNRSAPPTPTATCDQLLHVESPNLVNLGLVTSSSLSNNINQQSVQSNSKTITKLSSSVSVTASSNNRSPSPHPLKPGHNKDGTEKPEKEKKKKELSSSRQKKFNRHFTQVSPDERVLNYFSCALVSDILLQGHLYITENYFAFYSNVFGYVTKLLIPIVSVVKISKEKTAKIIPNAVGVQTADERHVFGSFMSREAAYRLMLSVWRPVAPEPEEVRPKILIIPDIEASECSIEDDSSCSASGNESSGLKEKLELDQVDSIRLLQSHKVTSTFDVSPKKVKLDEAREALVGTLKPELFAKSIESTTAGAATNTGAAAAATTTTTSSSHASAEQPIANTTESIIKYKNFRISVPNEFNIVYLGIFLAIVLAFFSIYLMYRIYDLQTRTFTMHPYDFKLGDNLDVYAEVLRWQSQMQDKSSKEAQIILDTNLEQIAKVRKSLETLSILLHETSAKFPPITSDNEVDPNT